MRKSKRVVALGMVAALGLIAAACGGDDDDGGSATTTAGGGATTTAGAATTAGGATTSAAAPDIGELLSYDESAQCGVDRLHGQPGQDRGGRRADREVHALQPRRRLPVEGGLLGVPDHAVGVPRVHGWHGRLHREAHRHRPLQARATWDRGSQIVLEANEDYWGEPPVNDTVVFRWSDGGGAAARRAGVGYRRRHRQRRHRRLREDRGQQRPPARRARSAERLLRRLQPSTWPPFDNEEVRQAIGYAIDTPAHRRQLLPEGLRAGDAVPAAGHPRLRGGLRGLHPRRGQGQGAPGRRPATPTGST